MRQWKVELYSMNGAGTLVAEVKVAEICPHKASRAALKHAKDKRLGSVRVGAIRRVV